MILSHKFLCVKMMVIHRDFNASQVVFSGGFNKDSLYSLEEINSFLDEKYGKQININN